MKVHGEFTALTSKGTRYAELLNADDVRDGAFARVIVLSETEVLKATCCPATNLLFDELVALRERGVAVPECLPAVMARHGARMTDADGMTYRLWTVERLFAAGDLPGMRRARVLGKEQLSAFKPAYRQRLSRFIAADTSALMAALEEEQRYCTRPGTWQGCADIALAMGLRTEGPMRATFLFLNEFVTRHELELDLLTQGNILLDMFGRPCLSDPVAELCEPEPTSVLHPGTCLVARIPVSVSGVRMRMAPWSSLPMQPADRQELAEQLLQLGLTTQELEWNSEAHRRFMAQPAVDESIWALPDVAKHVRANAYQQAFCE